MSVESLAFIGNASAREGRNEEVRVAAEAFSIRRLEGSRWRLRRTRAMGNGCHSGTGKPDDMSAEGNGNG
jgi:hypothetical protein